MNKKMFSLGCAGVLLALVLFSLAACGNKGRLMSVNMAVGAPETLAQNGGDWIAAKVGVVLKPGDSLRTGENTWTRVDINDGSIISLAPETEIRLVELSNEMDNPETLLELVDGMVYVEVTKALGSGHFVVQTRIASASVVGSEMAVSYDSEENNFEVGCIDGNVHANIGNAADQSTQVLHGGDVVGLSGDNAKNEFSSRPMDEMDRQQYASLTWWGGEGTPGMIVRRKSPTPTNTRLPTQKASSTSQPTEAIETATITAAEVIQKETPLPTIEVTEGTPLTAEELAVSGNHNYTFSAVYSGNCSGPAGGTMNITIDFKGNQALFSGEGQTSSFSKVGDNTYQAVDPSGDVIHVTFTGSGVHGEAACASWDYTLVN